MQLEVLGKVLWKKEVRIALTSCSWGGTLARRMESGAPPHPHPAPAQRILCCHLHSAQMENMPSRLEKTTDH